MLDLVGTPLTALRNLGLCHHALGDYRQAIDLHTQGLAIARDIGHRCGEANALNYLGRARLALDDPTRAVTLFEQACVIADATGDIEPAVEARSGLAQAQLQLGDPAAALAAQLPGGSCHTRPRNPCCGCSKGWPC